LRLASLQFSVLNKDRYLSSKCRRYRAIPEANTSASQTEFDKEADTLLAGDYL